MAGEAGYKAISASTGLELELWLSLAKRYGLKIFVSAKILRIKMNRFNNIHVLCLNIESKNIEEYENLLVPIF